MPNLNVMRGGNKGANRSRLKDKASQYTQRQQNFENRKIRQAKLLKRKQQESAE